MTTTFYIVRHGQSEGNVDGDIMGANPPLTQTGIAQAQALAQQFTSIPIDQIIASNLLRAKQTAEVIAAHTNLPVSDDARIRERLFGNLEGVKGTEVSQKYQQQLEQFKEIPLADQMRWKLVEDMESLEEVLQRTLHFLKSITKAHQHQTILLVTHANVMLALLAHFSFINSFKELPYGSIQNTAYLKVEKNADQYQLVEVVGITKKPA